MDDVGEAPGQGEHAQDHGDGGKNGAETLHRLAGLRQRSVGSLMAMRLGAPAPHRFSSVAIAPSGWRLAPPAAPPPPWASSRVPWARVGKYCLAASKVPTAPRRGPATRRDSASPRRGGLGKGSWVVGWSKASPACPCATPRPGSGRSRSARPRPWPAPGRPPCPHASWLSPRAARSGDG